MGRFLSYPIEVKIEFDGKNGREEKTFTQYGPARKFWLAMDEDGKHPKIVSKSNWVFHSKEKK